MKKIVLALMMVLGGMNAAHATDFKFADYAFKDAVARAMVDAITGKRNAQSIEVAGATIGLGGLKNTGKVQQCAQTVVRDGQGNMRVHMICN